MKKKLLGALLMLPLAAFIGWALWVQGGGVAAMVGICIGLIGLLALFVRGLGCFIEL